MYGTKISTARWIMYGIPGNIGWLLYLVGRGRLFAHHGFPCFDMVSRGAGRDRTCCSACKGNITEVIE